MKKKRVLITGGAGFIGSHTADLLSDKGYKVRILDNLSPKTHGNKWPSYLKKEYELMKGDVRHKKHWEKALDDVDYVIHLAGWMDMLPEFSQFVKVNTLGTANLYETIVSKNLPIKKVVVASTQFVYGQGKWKCKKHGKIIPENRDDKLLSKGIWDLHCPICGDKMKHILHEETHANPPNQYAITKLAQEMMALTLGNLHGIPSSAMRYSIVHGARQTVKNAYSGALRIFSMQMMNKEAPSIYEDGKQLRDYVHVKDVALANVAVLESEDSNFKAFNVGGEKAYTVLELAKIIAKAVDYKGEIKANGQYRVGDTRHSVSDLSKLKKIGWAPQFTETEAIDEFLSWLKMHTNIKNATKKATENMIKSGVLRNVKV